MNITDELQKLQSLREAGALTDDEFSQLKARVLNHGTKPVAGNINAETANQFIHSITRSRTDSWLGGVCGGLAAKTDMPSWVWRLIFYCWCFCLQRRRHYLPVVVGVCTHGALSKRS